MKKGPVFDMQMKRLGTVWRQGQHVLVTGATGSGKTLLNRFIIEQRLIRDGFVVVFCCKLQPDKTLADYYKGFTRWKKWKSRPRIDENRILLWPAVEGLPLREAVREFKKVFSDALDSIARSGKWTVVIDEGLFLTSPSYLNFGSEIGMMFQLMRSANATMIILAQRPAHLPLAIYANIDHAFIGRASEAADLKRLADLDGPLGSKELQREIATNGKHDFTWIPVGPGWNTEKVNVKV